MVGSAETLRFAQRPTIWNEITPDLLNFGPEKEYQTPAIHGSRIPDLVVLVAP